MPPPHLEPIPETDDEIMSTIAGQSRWKAAPRPTPGVNFSRPISRPSRTTDASSSTSSLRIIATGPTKPWSMTAVDDNPPRPAIPVRSPARLTRNKRLEELLKYRDEHSFHDDDAVPPAIRTRPQQKSLSSYDHEDFARAVPFPTVDLWTTGRPRCTTNLENSPVPCVTDSFDFVFETVGADGVVASSQRSPLSETIAGNTSLSHSIDGGKASAWQSTSEASMATDHAQSRSSERPEPSIIEPSIPDTSLTVVTPGPAQASTIPQTPLPLTPEHISPPPYSGARASDEDRASSDQWNSSEIIDIDLSRGMQKQPQKLRKRGLIPTLYIDMRAAKRGGGEGGGGGKGKWLVY